MRGRKLIKGTTGYAFDPATRIARYDGRNVAILANQEIAQADLILGRGNVILRAKHGGKIGDRATPALIQSYEERAR